MEQWPLKGDLTAIGVSGRQARFCITVYYTLAEIHYQLSDLETLYISKPDPLLPGSRTNKTSLHSPVSWIML